MDVTFFEFTPYFHVHSSSMHVTPSVSIPSFILEFFHQSSISLTQQLLDSQVVHTHCQDPAHGSLANPFQEVRQIQNLLRPSYCFMERSNILHYTSYISLCVCTDHVSGSIFIVVQALAVHTTLSSINHF